MILYPDPCVPREAPVKKCSYKKVHVPTQELLHRKKCLLPDSKPESAGKLVLIVDLNLISPLHSARLRSTEGPGSELLPSRLSRNVSSYSF